MLNETTINKLNDIRLRSRADSLHEQMKQPSYSTLSFEERFGLIVDTKWARRKNRHPDRLVKKAALRFPRACIEDIEYHKDQYLDQAQMLRLSTGNYIHKKHTVIIIGSSRAGKTYIGRPWNFRLS